MEYVTEKWGGHPHYGGRVHVLGDDEHGTWLWGPAGRTISRGEKPLFVTKQDALVLVVRDAWWSAAWWVGHDEVDTYVNVGTPPVWEAKRITSIDLDLDVIRFCDGRLEIVDRDEFELHQRLYDYPTDVIQRAEEVADEVMEHMAVRMAPFDGSTATSWIERARGAALSPLM